MAFRRPGHARATLRTLAGQRGSLTLPGRAGAGRRRIGATSSAPVAERRVTKLAMDPGPHDRGVRAAQRACRPYPGIGVRGNRVVALNEALGLVMGGGS